MARNWCLIMLCISTIFLSGCWSKTEIEKIAIVSALGIDRVVIEGQDKWQLTLEIFHPRALTPIGVGGDGGGRGGGGKQTAAWVVTSIGDTLQEAANNFMSRTPRKLFYSHSNFIVIGKETAERENLADIIALFLSNKEVRLRNWVIVTDGTASELLTAGWELEQDISTEILGLIEQTKQRLSKAEVLNLKEVGEALVSPGRDVITGKVEVFRTPEPKPGGQESGQGTEQNSARLHGASVFSKGKMVGWFSDKETRGYLYIMGKGKTTLIPLRLNNNQKFDTSVKLLKGTSKIRPEIEGGEVRIKVEIKAEGQMEELFPGNFKVTSQLLEQAGGKVAQELKKEALAAIAKAQEYKADVFGFGEAIYRKDPRYWREVEENWRDYFSSLPVEVEVKVHVRGTGMFIDPVPSR